MSSPKVFSRYITSVAPLLMLVALLAASCEKECDTIAECYPIPTELPAVTCNGANTMGARVDSVQFVASYVPNTTSWGGSSPENGITAQWLEDGETIRVIGQSGLRPLSIDARSMWMWLDFRLDEIVRVEFQYTNYDPKSGGPNFTATTVDTMVINHDLRYDSSTGVLCGTFDAQLLMSAWNTSSLWRRGDTVLLREGRLDVVVPPR